MATQWHGPVPESCDICGDADAIADEFIDGATQYARWGFMCDACFRIVGVGLGPGRGQHYKLAEGVKRDAIGAFRKVAG